MIIEVVKSDREKIVDRLGKAGYKVYPAGMNVIAIHQSDPANSRIRIQGDALVFG